LGGEGANDVAFLLPSPPSRWNAIDDVGITHPIICRIPALTIKKGRRMEWFCESSRKNQESALVTALSAPPWKAPTGSRRMKPYKVHLSSLRGSKLYQDMAQTDIVHMSRPLIQFR